MTIAADANERLVVAGSERTLGTLTESLRTTWSNYRAYRSTLLELDSLTDRELADLGADRPGLKRFAREAVYGL